MTGWFKKNTSDGPFSIEEALKVAKIDSIDVESTWNLFLENRIFSQYPETKEYHSNHFTRYLFTLQEILSLPGTSKVLEIGAPPYGLTYLMKLILFDDITVTGFDEKNSAREQRNYNQTIDLSPSDTQPVHFEEYCFNLETQAWPFQDNTFDLIVCSEVLEHLALDPMHVFSESNRILKSGGRLLITVPNAIGMSNLAKLLRGEQPSSFPPYRPEGINLRHNRELTPDELEELFKSGGFLIDVIKTININPPDMHDINATSLTKLLDGLANAELRRDFLLGTGIKSSEVRLRYPTRFNLYFEWDIERLKKTRATK